MTFQKSEVMSKNPDFSLLLKITIGHCYQVGMGVDSRDHITDCFPRGLPKTEAVVIYNTAVIYLPSILFFLLPLISLTQGASLAPVPIWGCNHCLVTRFLSLIPMKLFFESNNLFLFHPSILIYIQLFYEFTKLLVNKIEKG